VRSLCPPLALKSFCPADGDWRSGDRFYRRWLFRGPGKKVVGASLPHFINGLKKLAKKTIFSLVPCVLKKIREASAHQSVRRKMVRRTFFGWGRRPLFEKDLLLLKHEREYLFIGRRKEKAQILRLLFEKKPVLLKGQAGVGKTALAEHLVQRLIAAYPKTIPFVFNEKIKSIKEILENFLKQQGKIQVVSESSRQEKAMGRFIFLVFAVARTCEYRPVFVFDNLEAFQAGFGQAFAEEFSDIKAVIDYLCQGGQFHVILTCRYPVPGFRNLQSFDLNQVGINDFLKKCLYIDVGHIHTYLREAAAEVKQKMGQSLLFSRLMALLDPGQQRILDLLTHFRVPVQRMALEHLHRLTLIEISLNRELDAVYYYVTPIVKDLLADYQKREQRKGFSQWHPSGK
jgi:hypothetical protein